MARERVTAVGEQTSLADRKRRAGQRLVIGLSGPSVDADLRNLIAEIRPAGFILFARNVVEPEQVRELNRELASLVDPYRPALLCVDQEGGRVQRVREPATRWPSMRTVGRAKRYTPRVAAAMARELRAMGFNVNFAPVADVDSNPANPIIGDRAFSARPDEVANHVVAFLEAQQAEGVVACAKHFPGHGDTHVDSHLDLPRIEREEADLRQLELIPFAAAVRAGVGSIMTSHVLFDAFDEDYPATLSPLVTRRLLRDELGFDGVVFSDDMEMKAVAGRWPVPEQIRRATAATVDVFLVCADPLLQLSFFQELIYAQERDAGFEHATTDAERRVQSLRERFFTMKVRPLEPGVVGAPEHGDLAREVRARGEG